jgi:electron transport complex protein RnfE
MAKQLTMGQDFVKGLWDQNPVLRQLLGLCPVLAVTTKLENGIGMALATTFVLVCSSLIISLVRKAIPTQVRIAAFIVVIATFVTIVDLLMAAFVPALAESLGMFIPLIVVNCLILGRQEAFASKNNPIRAVIDAFGMGIGFLIALGMLSAIRELLGMGTLLGIQIMPDSFVTWNLMTQAPGAFITLGLMVGAIVMGDMRKAAKKRQPAIDAHNAEFAKSENKRLELKAAAEKAAAELKAKKAAAAKAKAEAAAKAEEDAKKNKEGE